MIDEDEIYADWGRDLDRGDDDENEDYFPTDPPMPLMPRLTAYQAMHSTFFSEPARQFHADDFTHLCGLSVTTIKRTLGKLMEAGRVTARDLANCTVYEWREPGASASRGGGKQFQTGSCNGCGSYNPDGTINGIHAKMASLSMRLCDNCMKDAGLVLNG